MDGIEEEDGYSDDDLDALPVHAFHELQQDAILSTQQPRAQQNLQSTAKKAAQGSANGYLGGFDRLSIENHGGGSQQQPSSDYGDFDDEMLDGEIFDGAEEQPSRLLQSHFEARRPAEKQIPEPSWRQVSHPSFIPGPSQQLVPGRPIHAYGRMAQPVLEPDLSQRSMTQGDPEPEHVTALQAKLDELARENERLKRDYDTAKNEAFWKIGEIAIVRANRLKEKQEEDKKLVDERRLRTEEQAKHNAEVQKYKAELQKLSTDKAFTESDLARDAEQRKKHAKTTGKGAASKPVGKENKMLTPKKNKDGVLGDGFNDNEIHVQSPSKLALRSKPATPKGGAKRKRKPTENSPVKPLQLSQTKKDHTGGQPDQNVDQQSFEDPAPVTANQLQKPIVKVIQQDDDRFEFTQKVLDHRIELDAKRSIEALAAFAVPSKPDQLLSTTFLDGLSSLSIEMRIDSFPAALGLIIVDMWSQCLDAELYEAVKLLMDLMNFMLTISPPGTAPYLTDELTSLVQRTADVNLIPRIRRKPASKLTEVVDTKQCLEILHLMVYDCIWQQEELERFWRCMRVDFIAMSLKVDQPITEIHIAFDLLRAGVLKKTFAMIRSPGDSDQESSEQGLLQIISSLFIEAPRVLEGQEPYEFTDIAKLRLDALDLLEKLCETDHGSEAVAKSVNIFVRLIRFMNEELDALYDYQYGHELRIELLNKSLRLLYYITINYPELINIQERLATTPGGAHKYLIVLTRLSFSNGVFYEKGIEDDVVDYAHHMLEDWVTPEEGVALEEAFSTARK